jgi:hypothetical protein
MDLPCSDVVCDSLSEGFDEEKELQHPAERQSAMHGLSVVFPIYCP